MRKWLKSLKMCQNFSESVSRILSQVEGGGGQQTAVRRYAGGATRPFTVLVEGNIGSGKSTYLQHFSGSRHQDKVEVVMEPVEKWRNLNSHNLLQMMYEDPSRSWSLSNYYGIYIAFIRGFITHFLIPCLCLKKRSSVCTFLPLTLRPDRIRQ